MRMVLLLLLVLSVLMFVGCGGGSDGNNAAQLIPSMSELENMTYLSNITESGSVQLSNGSFQQPTYDRAGTVLVATLTNHRLTGYLNKNRQGAVVVLRTAGGAGSVYFDLAAVVKDTAGVHNIALASLGDRVKIRSMSMDDGIIRLQLAVHTPEDQPCCPSNEVVNVYTLRGEKLVLLSSEPFQE
jgi:hypothetical protein